MVDFAGWEMPVQYEGVRRSTWPCAAAAGIFDVSHMGEIRTSGPGARDLLQRLLSNDVVRDRRRRRAVQRALPRGRRHPRRPLHLPPRRARVPDRHQRLQPRRRPGLVPGGSRGPRRTGAGPTIEDLAMLAVQGPPRTGDRAGDLRRAAASSDARRAPAPRRDARRSSAEPATRARTASRCCVPPPTPRRSGMQLVRRRSDARRPRRPRHAAPGGLLPPLRQRPRRRPRADRSGPGMVLQGGHAFHRLRRRPARSASGAPPRTSSRSRSRAPASRVRATRSPAAAWSPAARSRRRSRSGSAWPTCPPRQAAAGTALEIDVRGKMRPAVVKDKPLYRKGS